MRRASMVAAAGGDIHPPAGDITLGEGTCPQAVSETALSPVAPSFKMWCWRVATNVGVAFVFLWRQKSLAISWCGIRRVRAGGL